MNRRIHTEVISFGFYEHFVGVIVVGYTSVVTSSFLRFKHQHKMKRKIISREYTVHMYIRYKGTIQFADVVIGPFWRPRRSDTDLY